MYEMNLIKLYARKGNIE